MNKPRVTKVPLIGIRRADPVAPITATTIRQPLLRNGATGDRSSFLLGDSAGLEMSFSVYFCLLELYFPPFFLLIVRPALTWSEWDLKTDGFLFLPAGWPFSFPVMYVSPLPGCF